MRLRRLLVLAWVAATVVFATHLGSSERTQAVVVPAFMALGLDELWARRSHKVLRKAGHVLAYAGFALLVWWALEGVKGRARKAVQVVIGLAIVDETLQSLSSERGGSPLDVLLDVLAGTAAVLWAERRARRRAQASLVPPRG
jgi:hypothetical protein